MLKIDIHTHLLPPEIPRFKDRFGYGGFIELERTSPCRARMLRDDGTFFRDVEDNLWDADKRLAECERFGVDIQVLSTVPVMFSYGAKPRDGHYVSQFLNDHLAGFVSKKPMKFIGLGTLPLQDSRLAIQEMERCLKMGMPGFQIGTHVNGKNLEDPSLFEILQAAESLSAALFIHPWDMLGGDRMRKYWLSWLVSMPTETAVAICSLIFGGVLEKLPRLRVAFAHGGGAFPAIVGRISHGFEVRPDLCAVDNSKHPREYLSRIYVDSLVHDADALRNLIQIFGADRIALGSDYPFPLGERHPGQLIEHMPDLDPDTKARLLGGTACEWLGKGLISE